MQIELSEKEIDYLIKVLEDKLESIPILESAERFEPGILLEKFILLTKNAE